MSFGRALDAGITDTEIRAAKLFPNPSSCSMKKLFALLRKASGNGTESVPKSVEPPEVPRGRKSRKRQPILEDTIDTMERRLELHIFPYVGKVDIGCVTGNQLLCALRRLEEQEKFDLTHRVRSICGRVFRYGNATGRQCTDVAADLIGLLVPVETQRHQIRLPTLWNWVRLFDI